MFAKGCASFGVELSDDFEPKAVELLEGFEPKAAELSEGFEPKAGELSVDDLPKAELLEAWPLKDPDAEVPNIPELGLLSILVILDVPKENPAVSFFGLSLDDFAPKENAGFSEEDPIENAAFSVELVENVFSSGDFDENAALSVEPVDNEAFSDDPIENADFSVVPLENAGTAAAIGFGLELLPKENGELVNFSVGALDEPKLNPVEAGLSSFGADGETALLLAPNTKLDLTSGSEELLLGGAPKEKPAVVPEVAADAPNAKPPPGLESVSDAAAPNLKPPVSPNAGLVPLVSVVGLLFSDTENGAIFGWSLLASAVALLKTKLPNDGFTGSAGFDVINDENDGLVGSAPPEGEPKANPPPPPADGVSVAGDFKKLKPSLPPAGLAAANPPKPEKAFFFSGSSPTLRRRAFRMTRPWISPAEAFLKTPALSDSTSWSQFSWFSSLPTRLAILDLL